MDLLAIMCKLTKYNGYVSVCDWVRNGDYSYLASILRTIEGVTISDYEKNEDGDTAYIYFECTKESILPLLHNHELERININFPFSTLMPDDVTVGLTELLSEDSFVPAAMTDDLHSLLSWEFSLSYDNYLCKFESHQDFLSLLANHKLSPTCVYRDKHYIHFYGTGSLKEQFEMGYDKMFENLKYYFPNKPYTAHSLYDGKGWMEAISSNFVEVIYIPRRAEIGKLTTRVDLKIQKVQSELEEIPDMLLYFFQNRKSLTCYDLDFQGTTKEQFVLSTTSVEGLKFGTSSFPDVIQKISCNKQKVELFSIDGKVYTCYAGSLSLPDDVPTGLSALSEHDIYMSVLYNLDFEYFFD